MITVGECFNAASILKFHFLYYKNLGFLDFCRTGGLSKLKQ